MRIDISSGSVLFSTNPRGTDMARVKRVATLMLEASNDRLFALPEMDEHVMLGRQDGYTISELLDAYRDAKKGDDVNQSSTAIASCT